MRNNKSIRYERGPCRLHKDCVASTGKRPLGDTTITYLESNATSPPDILYVGSKRYEITPGLKVNIKNGEYHSIKSYDPKSLRKLTAKDEEGNDVMMSTTFEILPIIAVGSFGLGWLLAKNKYN